MPAPWATPDGAIDMGSLADRTRVPRTYSVRDLLEAREVYHVHLAHLANVVATGIGLHRFRRTDDDSIAPTAQVDIRKPKLNSDARTLANSVVTPWSWPTILVFVDKWLTRNELSKVDPAQVVPNLLYLPDGRAIPTCVILAESVEAAEPITTIGFGGGLFSGGQPVLSEVQGVEHVGSLGCLVTDGNLTYAMTSRHVTGQDPSREVFVVQNGARVPLGHADGQGLRTSALATLYRGWPDGPSVVNLDIGLVQIDDLGCWTAQVYGVGEVAAPVDLNVDTYSFDLIGQKVRAHGGVSGDLRGEIQALFYRYASIGGRDYTAELLIGPRETDATLDTRPGDSGTVWFADPDGAGEARRPGARAALQQPIAIQWGGSVLGSAGASARRFALATALSTVLRELDMSLVSDWNIGHAEYWGKLGHYKIAASALGQVGNVRLRKLLLANLDRIAYGDPILQSGAIPSATSGVFTPLADVADLRWRWTRHADEANHFADMDQPGSGADAGMTLLDLVHQDPANLSIDRWNAFYAGLGEDRRGALPFRIWQMYDAMVAALRRGDVASFVCIGGLMSHYAGDACQPLHVSYLHHGRPDHPSEKPVHSAYETQMLDRYGLEIVQRVNQGLGARVHGTTLGGAGAARKIVDLMRASLAALPPMDIITAFDDMPAPGQIAHMYDVLGDRTVERLVAGVRTLARLWASAWLEGNGAAIPDAELVAIPTDTLMALYDDRTFVPSYRLQDPAFVAIL
jgi:hypothetical protein